MDLAYAGFAASSKGVDTFSADSLTYAKKAIQLLQAGTAPEVWVPYTGKDEALSYLNNTIGYIMLPKEPSESLPYLLKAAQLEGKLKKQPITYGYIGDAYQTGPYAKLSASYKACCEGKDETPESKLILENINQVIDRMIDAYARAVSLSGAEPANQASKKAWMETLTNWYKYRNKTDAGLNDLIASVMSKPLPPEPTPLTTLPTPAATPAATTTPSGSMSNTGASTSGTAVAPTTIKPIAPAGSSSLTTTPKTTTAPASTVKPVVKPTRNNHRSH
jgi:hypothetical protein